MELVVALDTNAYSDWRRASEWHEILSIADRILLPVPVLGELYHGFRKGRRNRDNCNKLHAFLTEPQVLVAETTHRTAGIYGDFLYHLQKRATPIPTNDIWIAAVAYEHSATLLTRDNHFVNLPQISLNLKTE
jgi:tRNA(fMet)-specific endonuclease VapC